MESYKLTKGVKICRTMIGYNISDTRLLLDYLLKVYRVYKVYKEFIKYIKYIRN